MFYIISWGLTLHHAQRVFYICTYMSVVLNLAQVNADLLQQPAC